MYVFFLEVGRLARVFTFGTFNKSSLLFQVSFLVAELKVPGHWTVPCSETLCAVFSWSGCCPGSSPEQDTGLSWLHESNKCSHAGQDEGSYSSVLISSNHQQWMSKKRTQNHRKVWGGRELKDRGAPTPCHRQCHQPAHLMLDARINVLVLRLIYFVSDI